MYPDKFWQKELLDDSKNKKTLAMKFILPLILLSPLIVFHIPLDIKAIILTLFILFTGTLGTSVKLTRLKESNMLEKLAVLPISPARLMLNFIFANSLFDGLQLLIPSVLIVFLSASQVNGVFWIFTCYIAAVLCANVIGVLVALIAGSSGEVHLYSTLTVLLVGAISIPFTSSISGIVRDIGSILPFRLFYDSLIGGWGLYASNVLILAPISSAAILGLVLLLSPRLFRFH
ncbi:MAG: ABC transporter permease [Methanobacterium sp.]